MRVVLVVVVLVQAREETLDAVVGGLNGAL